jgi:transposase
LKWIPLEMSRRRNDRAELKSKVVVAAIRGDGAIAELASRYGALAKLITKWKREALECMKETFDKGNGQKRRDYEAEVKRLHAKISELVVERDLLSKEFDR